MPGMAYGLLAAATVPRAVLGWTQWGITFAPAAVEFIGQIWIGGSSRFWYEIDLLTHRGSIGFTVVVVLLHAQSVPVEMTSLSGRRRRSAYGRKRCRLTTMGKRYLDLATTLG